VHSIVELRSTTMRKKLSEKSRYLRMVLDDAVFTDVDTVLEAELVRHLAFRALAKTHFRIEWSNFRQKNRL
jgi:hypothetical protein